MALILLSIDEVIGWRDLDTALTPLSAVFICLAAAQVFGLRPVQSRWQVPEGWRRLVHMDVLPYFYGYILGLGFLTAVVTSAFWALVFLTMVVSPLYAICGWVCYALVRSLGFCVAALRTGGRLEELYVSRRWVLTANVGAAAAATIVVLDRLEPFS